MDVKELKQIADDANKEKHKLLDQVNVKIDEIFAAAKEAAERGEYSLQVDQWVGDYVPLSTEVYNELKKRGITVWTGRAYTYYINWR